MSIWLIILIISLLVFVVTELVTGIIPLGLGTAVSALLTYGLSFLIRSNGALGTIFIVLAIVFEVIFIRFCLKKTKPKLSDEDRAIGKHAKVIEKIDLIEGTGKVNVEGIIWKAKPLTAEVFDEGEKVYIEKIEGVSVVVSRIKEEE